MRSQPSRDSSGWRYRGVRGGEGGSYGGREEMHDLGRLQPSIVSRKPSSPPPRNLYLLPHPSPLVPPVFHAAFPSSPHPSHYRLSFIPVLLLHHNFLLSSLISLLHSFPVAYLFSTRRRSTSFPLLFSPRLTSLLFFPRYL